MTLRGAVLSLDKQTTLRCEKHGAHYWIEVCEGDSVALSLMVGRDHFRDLLDSMMALSAAEERHEVVPFNSPHA